ncbi:MAG: serine protease [Clostridia bacterium]|nr:serine protease [Clostridia bacterium]
MDEFDRINNFSGEEKEKESYFNIGNNEEKKVEPETGVNFSEDGTYHGKPQESSSGETAYNKVQPETPLQSNSQYSSEPSFTANRYASQQDGYGRNNYAGQQPYYQNNGGAQPPYGNARPPYYGSYSYNQNRPEENKQYAYPSGDDGNDKKKKSKGGKIFAIIAALLCVFVAVALIVVVVGDRMFPHDIIAEMPDETTRYEEELETNASPVTNENVSSEGELTPKSVFKKVAPSSVGILVYDRSKSLSSEGTGVLFKESADGNYTYIVTCAHVISGNSEYIRIQTYSGEEYEAEIVGFDARTDIGVLRVKETGFTLAEIGDSSKTDVGDPVYAIGNPGGVEFANSFTDGIVSALDRPVSSSSTGYTMDCIQHTAAINPGNSGGALVNAFGQVIGINSMKIVASDYEGMGFAVPSSVFVEIVNEIMTNGYVANRPKLGITYVAASEYENYGMFVALKGLPSGSIVIYEISSDSAFNGTEVREGDMITAVNGEPLDDPSYLSEYIENSKIGDRLALSIVRLNDDYSYDEFTVSVTLVEDRGDTFITEEEPEDNYGGQYDDNYDEYFKEYFDDYFSDYFGDNFPF